jgi:hypothetical protein
MKIKLYIFESVEDACAFEEGKWAGANPYDSVPLVAAEKNGAMRSVVLTFANHSAVAKQFDTI